MSKLLGTSAILLCVACTGASFSGVDGETVYRSKCASCHGEDGSGSSKAPSFTASEFLDKASDEEVLKVIMKGRAGEERRFKEFASGMPGQELPPEESGAVVAYLKATYGQ